MFEKTKVEAYRQVKAPRELKERVMESYQTKPVKFASIRLYKGLSVAAACLVLILSGTAFTNQGKVSILFGGEPLGGRPMTVAEANDTASQGIAMASLERSMTNVMCVPLEIEVSRETNITASAGEMQIFKADTGEWLHTGTEYVASEDVLVDWYVEGGRETSIQITSGNAEYFVCLEYDKANDAWMICQK